MQSLLPTFSARKATESDAKDLFNATLVREDDQVQAHKIISGICSPLFQQTLPEKLLGNGLNRILTS